MTICAQRYSTGSAFDIDVQSGIVFSKFFGRITPVEVLSQMIAVRRDKRFRKGMHTLADIRASSIKWAKREIVEFRTSLFKTFRSRLHGRYALLVDDFEPDSISNTGVAGLLENLYLRVDTRQFSNVEKAILWLNERPANWQAMPTASHRDPGQPGVFDFDLEVNPVNYTIEHLPAAPVMATISIENFTQPYASNN